MTDTIEGHRVGCPTLTEPLHHGCRVAEDGSIERYTTPNYADLRAENKRLVAEVYHWQSIAQVRGNQSDDYEARLMATDKSWTALAAERDALRAENERLRHYEIDFKKLTIQHCGPNCACVRKQRESLADLRVENERLRAAIRVALEKATGCAPVDRLDELAPLWAVLDT